MSSFLYLILNIGSLSVPLLYSVLEKKFHFIQYIKFAIISITLIAIPFLIWDEIFTSSGVWGFNDRYHLSINFLSMPMEEWMFFFCIPYACLFTHEVLKYYAPNFILSEKWTWSIGLLSLGLTVFLVSQNIGKLYTMVNFLLFIILMVFSLRYKLRTLQEYLPSFLVILIPFFIVNGILTGSFIEDQVVWYNNDENLGFRVFTIPFEDFFYAFNLLFSIQLLFNYFKNKEYVA